MTRLSDKHDCHSDAADLVGRVHHDLNMGRMKGRVPTPDFTTGSDLAANSHVSDAGTAALAPDPPKDNGEGQERRPASEMTPSSTAPEDLAEQSSAGIGVIALIKNEADVIEAFVSHILALFDVAIIIDHGSTDGTLEFLECASRFDQRLTVLHLNEPAYIQAQVMNYVLRTQKKLHSLEWIFFLDADEYLPFKDAQSLKENLAIYKKHPVISISWCNLIPSEYDHDRIRPLNGRTFFVPSSNSKFRKIALRPSQVDLGKVWLFQGNHSLQSHEQGSEIPSELANFPLFHIPIRSQVQFSGKLNQGIRGLNAYASIPKFMSQHWRHLRNHLDNTEVSDNHINAIIASYGEKIKRKSAYTHDQLIELGYKKQQLQLAQLPIPCQFIRKEIPHPVDKAPISSFSGLLSISALMIDESGNISVDVEKNNIANANANRNPKPYVPIWQKLRRLIQDFARLRFRV